MALGDWIREEPAELMDLRLGNALAALVSRYTGDSVTGATGSLRRRKVFGNVLASAYAEGLVTVVVEDRYTDVDYRDEYGVFYARGFRRYPSITHRLHLFSGPPPTEVASPDVPAGFADLGYRGFAVLRPVPGAVVGRTMMAVPEGQRTWVTCTAETKVNFFGVEYAVEAAPFMAQDAQVGVCGHAAIWMVALYHHLKFGTPRRTPKDIAAFMPRDAEFGRSTPAEGVSAGQIAGALTELGLPPLIYRHDELPDGESFQSIACRYLDSRLPIFRNAVAS